MSRYLAFNKLIGDTMNNKKRLNISINISVIEKMIKMLKAFWIYIGYIYNTIK